MTDYAAMDDAALNRLCAERLGSLPMNAEKSEAAVFANARLNRDANVELLWLQLSDPRGLALAFLLATEGGQ